MAEQANYTGLRTFGKSGSLVFFYLSLNGFS